MTSSSQCHSNPVFVHPRKPPDPVKNSYKGQTHDLKTRVDIWMRVGMVPVDYGTFSQKFHLTMWLFQFITCITFKCYCVVWNIISMLVWIGLCNKLMIYIECFQTQSGVLVEVFGYIWQAFMLIWVLWYKNELKVSHKKQFNDPPNMKLATSLMNFECLPCGIFEGLSYHQEYEAIDPTIFVATVVLVDRIKRLVFSNFIGMVSSVSVIFDTEATYSCSSKRDTF